MKLDFNDALERLNDERTGGVSPDAYIRMAITTVERRTLGGIL